LLLRATDKGSEKLKPRERDNERKNKSKKEKQNRRGGGEKH